MFKHSHAWHIIHHNVINRPHERNYSNLVILKSEVSFQQESSVLANMSAVRDDGERIGTMWTGGRDHNSSDGTPTWIGTVSVLTSSSLWFRL